MIRQQYSGDREAWKMWRRGHPPIIGKPVRYLGLLEAHLKAYAAALVASKSLSLWAKIKHGLKAVFLPEAAYKEFLKRVDMQSATGQLLIQTRQALMAYRSRGKGRGSHNFRFGNKPGRYLPHQSELECARRRPAQIREGA